MLVVVPLQLEVRTDKEPLQVVPLPLDRPVVIGRNAASYLQLMDRYVTRRHLLVRPAGPGVLLTDLNTANGTYYQGQPVTTETRIPLDGVVRIGDTTLRLVAAFPIDPGWLAWNGGQIRELARAFAVENDHAGLPILADALEEAGCDLPWILEHLRGNEHQGKCFVVARLLDG
jgi:hypothetical protein